MTDQVQPAVPPGAMPPGGGPPIFGEPPAAPTRRRRWPILLSVVAGLLAIYLAVGFIWIRPMIEQSGATISLPRQTAGLTLNDSPEIRQIAAARQRSAAATFDDAVAGVYQDPADQERFVIVVGITDFFLRPKAELADAFDELRGGGSKVENLHNVNPGPLGGVMQCADVTDDGGAFAVCGWADHGSVAVGYFVDRPLADAEDRFRTMRGDMLKR